MKLHHRGRKVWVILTAASVCSLATALAIFSRAARADSSATPPADLQQLQQDRLSILKDIANLASQEASQGLMRPDEAARDNEAVARAELDDATTPDDRIAALQDGLNDARQWEAVTQRQVSAGLVPKIVQLQLKADELLWEIALAREEQRAH